MKATVFFAISFVVMGGFMFSEAAPSASPSGKSDRDFASALLAEGPAAELGDAASVYAWLIGVWEVRVIDHQADGKQHEGAGEWHFSWVLEGRAVQDVWISPPRAQRKTSTSKTANRYGTTLRVYDAKLGAWRVTFLNPVNGAHDELIGRRQGKDIVQEGRDPGGNQMRWVFTDIRPDAFRWYGERSGDGGKTWRLEAEFFGKRNR